ncbi:MAG: lamin tail domain-containing protein, partial [Phycisphaerae bacterium]
MRERANVGWGMLAVAMVASISVNAAQAGSGGLIISEIVDATLPSGLPKWVELTNTSCDDIDLSSYSIGNVNNGGATMGFDALVLSGTLAAGDSFVVSYESGDAPGMSV